MKIILTKIAAAALFIIGLISLVSPIPGAFIFLACSLTLTVSVSKHAQFCVQWVRSRFAPINKFFYWLEKKTGERIKMIGETLPKTHPPEDTGDQKLTHKEFIAKMQKQEEEEEENQQDIDK